jgi:hypothetical protein
MLFKLLPFFMCITIDKINWQKMSLPFITIFSKREFDYFLNIFCINRCNFIQTAGSDQVPWFGLTDQDQTHWFGLTDPDHEPLSYGSERKFWVLEEPNPRQKWCPLRKQTKLWLKNNSKKSRKNPVVIFFKRFCYGSTAEAILYK